MVVKRAAMIAFRFDASKSREALAYDLGMIIAIIIDNE
jgi:hypothetical protein